MGARKRKAGSNTIYELYVELQGIEPLIWRRLLVPAAIPLPELHHVLQLAMGWTDSHMHSFTIGDRDFGMGEAGDLEEMNMLDERRRTLESVLGEHRELLYTYDFGDSWEHRITIKPLARPQRDWHYPLCIGGARAAPPDDVGGPPGYEEFLAAIKNPRHKEHEQMLTWIGGAFDPEGFDLNAINRVLRFGSYPYSPA
jgi:hypothetical protein